MTTPGERLRALAAQEGATPVAGAINPYAALLAARAGIEALYLSGGATAATLGLPDLGVLEPADVCALAATICRAAAPPLLVDADTGFGNELAIARTVARLEAAGAAGLHLEDQVAAKRCGHRPAKRLVDAAQMQARIRAACAARADASFVVMARTDAIAGEGIERALERAGAYVAAGADMVFLEAATEIGHYAAASAALKVPVLANLTEFGVTPPLGLAELGEAGVALALYPLTAFRTMMKAAEEAYAAIAAGAGGSLLERMQTRDELYAVLDYHAHEARLAGDDDGG